MLKMSISREAKIVFSIALMGAMFVFLTGISSDIYLGDEVYHYRYARLIYETGKRPVFDPLVHTTKVAQRKFMVEPLWHTLLAGIWKIIGKPTQLVAQIYQSIWYFLLVISVYLLGQQIYDRQVGLYGSLIIATMPMVGAFSVMLYLDVMVATLIVFCFLALTRNLYSLSGFFLGLAFLTKRNSYLLFPCVFFWILFFSKGEFKLKLKNEILFLLPLILLAAPDLYFRSKYLGTLTHPPVIVQPIYSDPQLKTVFIHPDNLDHNPENLLKYLGIPLWLGVVLYFLKKKPELRDGLFLIVILGYLPLYFHFFRGFLAVRYLLPVVPVISLLSAKGLLHLREKQVRFKTLALIILFSGQFLGALAYVRVKRTIPPGIRSAYEYVKQKTPPDARFLVARSALSLYTGRKAIWQSEVSLTELDYLFWKANEKEALNILRRYEVDHIFVEKDRISGNLALKDLKNYPVTFVKRLGTFNSLHLVFENDAVTIWKVNW